MTTISRAVVTEETTLEVRTRVEGPTTHIDPTNERTQANSVTPVLADIQFTPCKSTSHYVLEKMQVQNGTGTEGLSIALFVCIKFIS